MKRTGIAHWLRMVGALLLAAGAAQAQVLPPSLPSGDPSGHAGHTHEEQTPSQSSGVPAGAGAQDHGAPAAALPPYIPPLTDEDRKAAFPDVHGHAVHDHAVQYFVLFDEMEWHSSGDEEGFNLDAKGWIGRDLDRLWFRTEVEGEEGAVHEGEAHLLYGHSFSRWWDVVAGMRQDFRPGPARSWAAIGLQGLAPYWFEVESAFYIGQSGRTHARLEVEYEVLLSNRLVLQPLVELDLFGKSDPERGIGAGLSTGEVGFRLRYEFRREFAPYFGVVWDRKFGKTADFAKAANEEYQGARWVAGLRLWF